MKKINFLFGIHNHQPVGNFHFVFEDSYQRGYLPFLELLKKYPAVKISIHFSGILLSWINDNHPECIALLKTLTASGQLEILTGGFYEPILPVIPDRDKLSQIKKLTGYIKDKLDYESSGLWLAERVWEPHLPKVLNSAGIKYTILDDTHFKYSGLEDDDLTGYYLTEEEGQTLALFPISKTLRYAIPFQKPSDTIDYLKSLATEDGDRIAVYADDGEKFGVWPGTYQHCFTEKWLEKFFKALSDNLDWINIVTFSEALESIPPVGRVYLPTASYMEMTEWALPAKAIEKYDHITDHFKNNDLWDSYNFLIRGGFWRNFLAKYPESNNMHKKMLLVSEKINQLMQSTDVPTEINKAHDYLMRGQCNCPYWHGVFGGLYLPHVRSAIYQNLIMAEKLADNVTHKNKPWTTCNQIDFDKDGYDELVAESTDINYYFKPSFGGQIFELDYKPANLNIVDTITRQPEGYHSKIKEALTPDQKSDTASIHDVYRSKEKGLEKLLSYDWYRRGMFIDHFLKDDVSLETFSTSVYGEEGDFVNQPYEYKVEKSATDLIIKLYRTGGVWCDGTQTQIKLEKQFLIKADSSELEVTYQITNLHDTAVKLWFGTEFNFGFPNIPSPNVKYMFNDEVAGNGFKLTVAGEKNAVNSFGLFDGDDNFKLNILLDQKTLLWRFPVYSVSLSEEGFEKVQQGICLLPSWKISLDQNKIWKLQIKHKFSDIVPNSADKFKQIALARA